MAAPGSSYTNQQPRLQPHLPKLLYRTTSSNTTTTLGSLGTSTSDVSSLNASTAPTSPRHPDHWPSPTSARLPPGPLAFNGPKSPSLLPPKTPPLKKKGGSFLRMFTVKEPSTQAFEDYQKQMMKKGASKNGRVVPVGMPGVSSAKLPPTVPKVNSKWDGVPQAIKEREKEKDAAVRKSMSGCSRSIASSASDRTQSRPSSRGLSRGALDHRVNGKLSYNQSSGNLSDIYGWENRSSSSGSVARDFAFPTPSLSAEAEFTSFFPRYNAQPPNTPSSVSKQTLPELVVSPEHYASPALTPNDSSPATPPSHPSPKILLASPHSNRDLKDGIKTTTLEISPDTEEVIIKSSGVNILGPPASARRKAKTQPFPTGEAEQMKFQGETLPLRPILKKDSKPRTTSTLPRSPPSTTAPRTKPDTMKRPNSARGRLGLGVNVRNSAVAPWDSPENAAEEDDSKDGTPTPQKSKRLSRISLFSK